MLDGNIAWARKLGFNGVVSEDCPPVKILSRIVSGSPRRDCTGQTEMEMDLFGQPLMPQSRHGASLSWRGLPQMHVHSLNESSPNR
jgi:hypothetical protein